MSKTPWSHQQSLYKMFSPRSQAPCIRTCVRQLLLPRRCCHYNIQPQTESRGVIGEVYIMHARCGRTCAIPFAKTKFRPATIYVQNYECGQADDNVTAAATQPNCTGIAHSLCKVERLHLSRPVVTRPNGSLICSQPCASIA